MPDGTHSQFFHIDAYGVQSRRKRAPNACISGIAAEAARLPGACGHIADVRPPTILRGMCPVEAGRIAIGRATFAVDSCGRKLRSDGVAMLAVVASYPVPRAVVEGPPAPEDQAPQARTTYEDWRTEVVAWMSELFGEALLSVVEHTDETYLHLHGLVVPDVGEDGRLQLDQIHPGRAAIAQVKKDGGDPTQQNSAYRQAMRLLQDDFHTRISAAFGHHRHGPRRERRERQLHLAIRRAEERRAEIEKESVARQAAFDAERMATLARLREEFDEGQRLAISTVRRDADREKAQVVERLHHEMAKKERMLGKAAGMIHTLRSTHKQREAENKQLSTEILRLRALLHDREAKSQGVSFRR